MADDETERLAVRLEARRHWQSKRREHRQLIALRSAAFCLGLGAILTLLAL